MACANCMASARVTPLRGAPSGIPSGIPSVASLAFAFSLRGTRARRAGEPGRFGPCRRLRVASIAGPSGLPSVTVLVLICALARVWPGRDPERVCFGPYQRLCAASVLGPNGIPSLFAGAAPAKLRAYLWALKSKIRGRCFFRIMDLSFSCG